MLLQSATLLLLTLSLVCNSNGLPCLVGCASQGPADVPIQKCETHSYFLSTSTSYDRLPRMEKGTVIYGNAGYYRSYGAEVYAICKMAWVHNDLTMAMVHVEDSMGYISEAVQFKPKTSLTTPSTNVIKQKRTTFAIPNPTPLAEYFCVCTVTAIDKPKEVKSCLKCKSSKQPLPPIKTCSVDTCYSNQDQPMCYENVQSGDVYHNWPHQLFNNTCPYAAKQFDEECALLDEYLFPNDDRISFYIGDQLVHSGSVYYVIGDETLVVRSKCDIKAAGLKCQAWIWKNTTGIGERNREMIELKLNPKEEQDCSVVTFSIRATDFTSNISQNSAVNLVGCHHPLFFPKELRKQVEFYINFVEIVESVGPGHSLQCIAPLQTQDVVEPAVTLSPDTCACNLTLVSCNPMVTVRRVEHTFRCDNGKLWTGTTTKKLSSLSQKTTAGTAAAIPPWVWIVLAFILVLLTVVMILVMLYTHKGHGHSGPSSKTAKPLSDDKPKQPKMILDNSMFQSKLLDDQGSSSTKDTSSSIHKRLYGNAGATADTESDYFYSG